VTARHLQFERLYEEHSRAVLRYCVRRAPSAALADEACSETFLVAWRRFDKVPDEALPWLLAVARRVLGNMVRGDARREALKSRLYVTASDWAAGPEGHDDPALDAAMARLGEPDREALMLVYWDGLSTAEAAAAMKTTAAAVRARLYRARRRLERDLRARETQIDLLVPKPSKELR
jgi:RNA polymerase sigma-70 factor, ECF subfamily